MHHNHFGSSDFNFSLNPSFPLTDKAMDFFPGRYVGVHGLKRNSQYNGMRAVIIGCSKDRWLIQDIGGAEKVLAVQGENICPIPQKSMQTTKASFFNQHQMLTCFQAPDLTQPVPDHSAFLDRQKPPGIDTVKGFWGNQVFKYMLERLNMQLNTQKSPGFNRHFIGTGDKWKVAIVFSDGTKPTQQTPYNPSQWGMWWPGVCVPIAGSFDYAFYCQEQALSSSRAWPTHGSRVAFLYEEDEEEEPMYVSTPGVKIEELPPNTLYGPGLVHDV